MSVARGQLSSLQLRVPHYRFSEFTDLFKQRHSIYCQIGVGTGKTLVCAMNVAEMPPEQKTLVIVPTKEIALNFYVKVRLCNPQATVTRLGSLTWVAPVVHLMSDAAAQRQTNFADLMSRMGRENAQKQIAQAHQVTIVPVSLLNLLTPDYRPSTVVVDEFDLTYSPSGIVHQVLEHYEEAQQVLLCGLGCDWAPVQAMRDWKSLIKVGSPLGFPLTHRIKHCQSTPEKDAILLQALKEVGKCIVFVNSVDNAKHVGRVLREENIPYRTINPDQPTEKRMEMTFEFNAGNIKQHRTNTQSVLISTHIGSRSLDYPNVHTVIQYDFPEDETSFYQQAGRVARIGKPTAEVVSLVTVNDMPLLEQISLRLD